MSSELKPCPFCKRPPESRENIALTSVRCSDSSGDCVASRYWVESDGWNRRAPSPAVKALVEACRALKLDEALTFEGDLDAHAFFSVDALNEAKEALAAVEREIGGA